MRVWAPRAERVDVAHGEGLRDRTPMIRGERGWFHAEAPLAPGDDYGFSLDGGEPRPDPRSLDQPHGPHGPSRVYDQNAFAWRHGAFRAAPVASGVIYEMHVGTFTPAGTLDAAIHKLDYLADLGVTHVELLPLNTFDGTHGWGYDGVNWFAPHRPYCEGERGAPGPDAVKRFVDACHERDLAVVLDVVYNHLGPSGNYLGEFGPYFAETYNTVWGPALNLDGPDSDIVRRYIIDNAIMWLRDYRFDALRLDAVHAFFDRSAVHLLEQMAAEVREVSLVTGRPLELIAESDLNDPRVVTPREAGGLGMDAQWSDDFHHALHSLVTGETNGYYADFGGVEHLAKAFGDVFTHDGNFAPHRKRAHGRPVPGFLGGSRFLAYAQNHDQIGNRATGDRLTTIRSSEAARTAIALTAFSPYVPMLFQGEEWGTEGPFQYFTSFPDETLGRAVREGRRREFGHFGWTPDEVPDPQDPATFERSKLDWSEPEGVGHHREFLEFTRAVLLLRRTSTCLMDGDRHAVRTSYHEHDRWVVVRRGELLLAAAFVRASGDGSSGVGDDEALVTVPLAGVLDEGERADTVALASSGRCDGSRAAVDGVIALPRDGSIVMRIRV